MAGPVPMVELIRGDLRESLHLGHAVICGPGGEIVAAWGDPQAVIYPRSSCKMIQALPLVESGRADDLSERHIALACASHNGAAIHTELAGRWIADLGLTEADLRCGPQEPDDRAERDRLITAGEAPCQLHNNCSGKHAGFLHLNKAMAGGPEYTEPDHPLQRIVRTSFEEVTVEASPGYGIDGCSAPNFATSVAGLARAMAAFAAPAADRRGRAMERLATAMVTHPELVAGEGQACTELMRAMEGRVAVKTGAEGVYVAILRGRGIGLALKIADGATRASEAALTALLVHLGVLDRNHPAARRRLDTNVTSRRGLHAGTVTTVAGFP